MILSFILTTYLQDPLKGLVVCAGQAMAVGLAGGFFYKFFLGDPGIQAVEDYYKENPPR